jgi:hypothetical protein
MTRRGWLYACSGSLLVASLPLAVRCAVLMRAKPKAAPEDVEQQIVKMTNLARKTETAQPPLLPYFYHPALTDVARDQARKIATEQNWAPTEQWMEEELRLSGYGFPVMRYGVRGGFCQGVDGRPLSVPECFNKWLEEDRKGEPEERGILNPYYGDFGVGVFLNEATKVYYVAFVFGKRFRPKDIFVPKDKKDKDKDPGQ